MLYLKWRGASDAGHFSYYDKETETNKIFDLKEFTVLNTCYTIIGWDEDSNSAIWSNDVTDWKEDNIVVKSKGGELFNGTYDKAKIENTGAKVHIKATCLQDGQELTITLKGKNFFNFSEALKALDIKTDTVKYDGFTDEKAGAVKYRAPVFVKGTKSAENPEPKEEITVEDIPF